MTLVCSDGSSRQHTLEVADRDVRGTENGRGPSERVVQTELIDLLKEASGEHDVADGRDRDRRDRLISGFSDRCDGENQSREKEESRSLTIHSSPLKRKALDARNAAV